MPCWRCAKILSCRGSRFARHVRQIESDSIIRIRDHASPVPHVVCRARARCRDLGVCRRGARVSARHESRQCPQRCRQDKAGVHHAREGRRGGKPCRESTGQPWCLLRWCACGRIGLSNSVLLILRPRAGRDQPGFSVTGRLDRLRPVCAGRVSSGEGAATIPAAQTHGVSARRRLTHRIV